MKDLKLGMSFEVVEVIDYGFSDESLFKIGGFTVGLKYKSLINCLVNGECANTDHQLLYMRPKSEVKPIGKLTITKVK